MFSWDVIQFGYDRLWADTKLALSSQIIPLILLGIGKRDFIFPEMRLSFNPTIIDFQFAASDGEFRGQAWIYNDDKEPAWNRNWTWTFSLKRNISNRLTLSLCTSMLLITYARIYCKACHNVVWLCQTGFYTRTMGGSNIKETFCFCYM